MGHPASASAHLRNTDVTWGLISCIQEVIGNKICTFFCLLLLFLLPLPYPPFPLCSSSSGGWRVQCKQRQEACSRSVCICPPNWVSIQSPEVTGEETEVVWPNLACFWLLRLLAQASNWQLFIKGELQGPGCAEGQPDRVDATTGCWANLHRKARSSVCTGVVQSSNMTTCRWPGAHPSSTMESRGIRDLGTGQQYYRAKQVAELLYI